MTSIGKLLFLIVTLIAFHGHAVPGHFACYYEDNGKCCDEHPMGWCQDGRERNMIFKILMPHEWESFKSKGYFAGSPDDLRDQFIHLATAKQLNYVIEKYFKGVPIYIVGFYASQLGENLKWENGYPHLYKEPLYLNLNRGHYYYFYSTGPAFH